MLHISELRHQVTQRFFGSLISILQNVIRMLALLSTLAHRHLDNWTNSVKFTWKCHEVSEKHWKHPKTTAGKRHQPQRNPLDTNTALHAQLHNHGKLLRLPAIEPETKSLGYGRFQAAENYCSTWQAWIDSRISLKLPPFRMKHLQTIDHMKQVEKNKTTMPVESR